MKKGYFVRGEFVAEGSARDLELKAELKGGEAPSRTELKRASEARQKLGTALLDLRADLSAQLNLPDALTDAVAQAKRITDFEGKRRQMQFIGKLMRKLDDDTVTAIEHALAEQAQGSAAEQQRLHQLEAWRTRLLADDGALADWLAQHPGSDSQQLRALIRQARKDAVPEKPGAAPHHGRAYREIFQFLRDALDTLPEPDAAAPQFHPSHEA
ncbi:MAG: ribosome biogenesis factor YjgA [Rhodoferax sp.]